MASDFVVVATLVAFVADVADVAEVALVAVVAFPLNAAVTVVKLGEEVEVNA